jgi:hypothetical protein
MKHVDTTPEMFCGACSKGPFNNESFRDHILNTHPEMKEVVWWADKIVWTMYPEAKGINF